MNSNYTNLKLHPMSEKLVAILCAKTGNQDPQFFRIMLIYYLGLIASQMRANIVNFSRDPIPMNTYAVNLSPSGTGKGYATTFMEGQMIKPFKEVFLNHTFPYSAHLNMQDIASKRSIQNGTDLDFEEDKVHKEFDLVGSFLFNFDSATVPAVKQHRHKLQLANAGSLNFQVDEIGANLTSQVEVLHTFLELYDVGRVKDKLIKSSAENKRLERIDGSTPANMLLFGTPSKLLDGGRTEELFHELLEMGYARRSFFGYARDSSKDLEITPEQMVKNMFNTSNDDFVLDVADHLEGLAHSSNLHKNIHIEEPELIELMRYRIHCERIASKFPEQRSTEKAELSHRYFKALKLAGIYAFIEDSVKITLDHLENAIAMTEISGEAFTDLMKPEKNYMKLAKYLADSPTRVTLTDMIEELPYFKGTGHQKKEMLILATAYGYQNNIIIKEFKEGNVSFYEGESLEKTNLDKLLITVSNKMAHNYQPKFVSFNELEELGQVDSMNWCNHAFENNHRQENNVLPGFNLIVLDVDGGTDIDVTRELFKDITYTMYTTKSHTNLESHYRIIIPTNYVLKFDQDEYKEFINNIIEVLPLDGVDTASNQRSKKWLTANKDVYTNEAELFDVLPFIPKTNKNEVRMSALEDSDLDRLQAWVINKAQSGNRNNQLHNYACILADAGKDFSEIRDSVFDLNKKLSDSLDEEEIDNTIMTSVASKVLTH